MTHIVIIGAGFVGLNAAKGLGRASNVQVTLIDRRNYHLFQPLLYQVAMAGLSPADIAAPTRSILSRYSNIRVLLGTVLTVDRDRNIAITDIGEFTFDYLIMACGSTHSYFGHDEWAKNAPGLKTIEDATEIRRRVLTAFEEAERVTDEAERKKLLTFIVVGGGPTGVELAGAIGEMSRYTLARDFRSINAASAKVILIEAGPRILPSFSEQQAERATRDLQRIGVQVWVNRRLTALDSDGAKIGEERVEAATVLWAAGVQASPLGQVAGLETDRQRRVIVEPDLSVRGHPNIFVAGDQALYTHQTGKPLPGTAPVAMQQGRYIARTILDELRGRPRRPFHFVDKGQMATIGRSRAILEIGSIHMAGWWAWVAWLAVHIYYLAGFGNRFFVVLQWAWYYLTFRRGARLIVGDRSGLEDRTRSSRV